MRAVLLTEVPTTYRTAFIRFLREGSKLDLHVLYCATHDPWRGDPELELRPLEEVLKGVAIGGSAGGPRWKFNPQVWRRLSELRPDVVVIGGYAHPTMQLAMTWSRRHRVPYVLHSESNDLTPRAAWRRAAKSPMVRWAVRGADAYLPVSTPAADYLKVRGAPPERMFVLPNSPDVHEIAGSTRRDDDAERENGKAGFLFVGRLVAAKGVETLVEAFGLVCRRRTSAHLTLCGDGPLRPELQRQIARERLPATILGHVSGSDLLSHYAQADCFVLPSIYEPFGVVVMEALAAGVPSIVSDRVGCGPDLIADGKNGYIFPSGDTERLAEAMIAVVDRGGRASMGNAARDAALSWDYEFCAHNFVKALEVATSGQAPYGSSGAHSMDAD